MQDTSLKQCYEFALSDASRMQEECNVLSDEFPKGSALYKKASVGGVFKDILSFLFGIILLGIGVVAFFSDTSFPINEYIFSGTYVAIVLVGFGAVLLFGSVFSIYKMIMLGQAEKKAKKVRTLGFSVASAVKQIDAFKAQVEKAIATGEDISVEPAGFWQTQFLDYKATVAEKSRSDDKKNKLIHTIAAGLIFLFAAVGFYPFIIGGYALKFGNTSGALVATSYILITIIIAESLFRLERWYHSKAKLIAGAAFGVYQLAVVLGLVFNKTFAGISEAISSGDAGAIVKNILFNYPIISLILITVVMLIIITKTSYDLIAARVEEENFVYTMTDGSTETRSLKRMRTKIRSKCITKIPFVIAMGIWMAKILVTGLTFGNALLYVVIAAIYFGITFTMDMNETFNYVYGKLCQYLRLMLFMGYVTVTLSLVPGFGIGSIILVGLHALASLGGPAAPASER